MSLIQLFDKTLICKRSCSVDCENSLLNMPFCKNHACLDRKIIGFHVCLDKFVWHADSNLSLSLMSSLLLNMKSHSKKVKLIYYFEFSNQSFGQVYVNDSKRIYILVTHHISNFFPFGTDVIFLYLVENSFQNFMKPFTLFVQ